MEVGLHALERGLVDRRRDAAAWRGYAPPQTRSSTPARRQLSPARLQSYATALLAAAARPSKRSRRSCSRTSLQDDNVDETMLGGVGACYY